MNRFHGRAHPRLHAAELVGLLVLLLAAAAALRLAMAPSALPFREQQIRAAERMGKAYALLSARAQELGLPAGDDPNGTGVIGVEFNELTTTVGSLEAKRTATNPDFAALLVRLLHEAGLDRGDRAVLTLSGSFPALNIASIVACEELGVEPLVLSSVGASSYGANRSGMSWLDMESLLRKEGVIRHGTGIASLGGEGDLGKSFDGSGKALALEAVRRNGLQPLLASDAEGQQRNKLEAVRAFRPGVLVNAGGNQIAVGPLGHLLPPGIVTGTRLDTAALGLAGWFLEEGLPVVNLLRIRDLALRYGLPFDPVPFPPTGNSAVYSRSAVPRGWAAACAAAIALYVAWLFRRSRLREAAVRPRPRP